MNQTTEPPVSAPDPDAPDSGAADSSTAEQPRRFDINDLERVNRSSADAVIGGVAGGLGRYFNVDPILFRVTFVVLAFFGGFGLVLYAALWLILPNDATGRAVIRLSPSVRGITLVVAAVLAIAVVASGHLWGLLVLGMIGLGVLYVVQHWGGNKSAPVPPAAPAQPLDATAPVNYAVPYGTPAGGTVPPTPPNSPATDWIPRYVPPTKPRKTGPLLFFPTVAIAMIGCGLLGAFDVAGANIAPSAYPALVLAVVGAGLLLGSKFGRPGGLPILALFTAGILAVLSFFGDISTPRDHRATPTTISAYNTYSMRNGEYDIDLTRLNDPTQLAGATVKVTGKNGAVQIYIPRNQAVRIESKVKLAGSITVYSSGADSFGVVESRAGFAPHLSRTFGRGIQPPLVIQVDMRTGTIEITRQTQEIQP